MSTVKTAKPKVYLICTSYDERAASINTCPNVKIEYMGDCQGVAIREDGKVLGSHWSSSFGWLRADLKGHLDDPAKYTIVDMLTEYLETKKRQEECKHKRYYEDMAINCDEDSERKHYQNSFPFCTECGARL